MLYCSRRLYSHLLRTVDQPCEQAQRGELFERGLFVGLGAMGDQVTDELGAAHAEELRALVLAGPARRRVRVVV